MRVGEWGLGVRTDGVAMATPHWHAPDWTMWWLIIQRICLKKTIKWDVLKCRAEHRMVRD